MKHGETLRVYITSIKKGEGNSENGVGERKKRQGEEWRISLEKERKEEEYFTKEDEERERKTEKWKKTSQSRMKKESKIEKWMRA